MYNSKHHIKYLFLGLADGSQSYVIQNMLSPVTITIDGTDYMQAQVPGVVYNYLSSGTDLSTFTTTCSF